MTSNPGENSDNYDHDHEVLKYNDDSAHDYDEMGRYALMSEALKELLIERNVVSAGEVREYLDFMDSRGEHVGAEIIAKAWTNPDFKKQLMTDGTAAVAGMGVPMAGAELIVVENTEDVHNLVVCTLCSCYPRTILGLPPDWYKSKVYRSRAVHEPRAVLREFGTILADHVSVRVHDSNADMRYLVMPKRPAGTGGWNVLQLAELVTRDSMIGIAGAQQPPV